MKRRTTLHLDWQTGSLSRRDAGIERVLRDQFWRGPSQWTVCRVLALQETGLEYGHPACATYVHRVVDQNQ